jgi:hypothetical protein
VYQHHYKGAKRQAVPTSCKFWQQVQNFLYEVRFLSLFITSITLHNFFFFFFFLGFISNLQST